MILFPMIGEIYLSQSKRSLLKAKRSLGKMRQPVYHGRYQFTVADGPIKETVMKNHLHDLGTTLLISGKVMENNPPRMPFWGASGSR